MFVTGEGPCGSCSKLSSCIIGGLAQLREAHRVHFRRQYCTRKLHRLHKALKVTHGRGKYVPRKLEAKSVTEVG